jgi:hypothetical protein
MHTCESKAAADKSETVPRVVVSLRRLSVSTTESEDSQVLLSS